MARARTHEVVAGLLHGSTMTPMAHLTCAGHRRADLESIVTDYRDEGVEKPDPRLFRIALDRAAARPESTIHVGDLYQVDVVGARAAGLRAVLLDETNLRPDADCDRVASLGELVERVRSGAFD